MLNEKEIVKIVAGFYLFVLEQAQLKLIEKGSSQKRELKDWR